MSRNKKFQLNMGKSPKYMKCFPDNEFEILKYNMYLCKYHLNLIIYYIK